MSLQEVDAFFHAYAQAFNAGARFASGVKAFACTAYDENLQDFQASSHAAS